MRNVNISNVRSICHKSHFNLDVVFFFCSLTYSIYTSSSPRFYHLKKKKPNEKFHLQMKSPILLVFLLQIDSIFSWESYELDLFDLVEEIGLNNNFYEFFSVEKTAELSEIKKAYR